ncbi:hypothetical protein NC652_036666 [Populus alba x Populus x berolinensis]|nr:hypothetical protein NC652_036666 [Populus alba x Populus x berolinensis]
MPRMDEIDQVAHFAKKFANVECQRVMVDDSFTPSLEDEAIEVQHLLAEPETDHVLVDGVSCFGNDNSSKRSEKDAFSYGFDDDMRRNIVDEVDDIHEANDFYGAYEDFLLDIELAEKVSYLDSREGSQLRNSISDSQSPGCSGSSNGAVGMSESSTATVPVSESKNGPLQKTVKCKLHCSSGDKWDSREPAEDGVWPTSDDLDDLDELDDDAKPLMSLISGKNVKKAAKAGTLLRQKRLRKPTKRYIEEFSDTKSKHEMERRNDMSATSKDQRPKFRSNNELRCEGALTHTPKEESFSENITRAPSKGSGEPSRLRSKPVSERQTSSSIISRGRYWSIRSQNEPHLVRAVKSAPKELSFAGPSAQAPFESQPQRGRPKKPFSILFLESEDDCVKKRCKKSTDRRKHQRMWTAPEVLKLIDGIAQYGTGRWADITKLMFSSTAYRTPIDLRMLSLSGASALH